MSGWSTAWFLLALFVFALRQWLEGRADIALAIIVVALGVTVYKRIRPARPTPPPAKSEGSLRKPFS